MHLFARLAARTGELDPILEELHRQHADETGLVGALEASIGEFAAHPEQGAGAMSAAVAAFAGHAARHMRIEEDVVIPAARRLFSENDWRDLDAAFTAAATGPAAGRLRSLFGDIVDGDASRG